MITTMNGHARTWLQTDRQIDGTDRDRQTERQTDRQTDKQKDRDRN